MGITRKRAMAVLLLVIAWQGKTSSGGYATYRPWQKWIRTPLYNRHGDVRSHVTSLVKSVEDLTQSGKNTMISDGQNVELPENPVRDTPFEQLMVATLLDDGPGVVAAYAESGSGKSTAATLAIVEAAKYSTSDFFVLLQNELDYNLEMFFCLSQVSSTATIATAFFQALKKKGVRLHLVFDNVLDSGANDYIVKDRLKALARAACDCGHQLLFTMQEQAAAESVANLDPVTTSMARVQNSTFGAYRWNQNEAEQLITDIKATFEATPQIEMNMTKALTESKIPDELGQWRPRTIDLFMAYGVVPKRRMRAGWAGFIYSLTDSKLHEVNPKQPHQVEPGEADARWWCCLLIQVCSQSSQEQLNHIFQEKLDTHFPESLCDPQGLAPVWVQHLRKDSSRRHPSATIEPAWEGYPSHLSMASYPKSKVVIYQVSIAGFQRFFQRFLFLRIKGHCRSWDVPPNLEDQNHGREMWSASLIDTFMIVFRSSVE